MPRVKDNEVWIDCGGTRCKEYEVNTKEDAVTCYIESQVDKTFSINWKNYGPEISGYKIRVAVSIDGILTAGRHTTESSTVIHGKYVSTVSFRKFKFSSLVTTDEEENGINSSELGTINVKILRVQETGTSSIPNFANNTELLQKPIYEKSKFTSTHRAGLGDKVICSPKKFSTWKPLDAGPLVTYEFLYRPKELLFISPKETPLAIGIIQSKPIPKRLRSASDVLEESRDREYKKLEENKENQRNKKNKESTSIKYEPANADLSKDDDIEQQLLAQMAELSHKLEEYQKRKRIKVKSEIKEEILNDQGVIDLTCD